MIDRWIEANAETVQYAVFFGLFAVLAVVELLHPRRAGPMERRRRWVVNFLLTGLNIAVMSLLPVSFLGIALLARRNG